MKCVKKITQTSSTFSTAGKGLLVFTRFKNQFHAQLSTLLSSRRLLRVVAERTLKCVRLGRERGGGEGWLLYTRQSVIQVDGQSMPFQKIWKIKCSEVARNAFKTGPGWWKSITLQRQTHQHASKLHIDDNYPPLGTGSLDYVNCTNVSGEENIDLFKTVQFNTRFS